MELKQALLYLKRNIYKSLPLFLVIFFFILLFMTFDSINISSQYLTNELKNDLSYEIKIQNRLCNINDFNKYANGSDFYAEFSLIYDFLNKYPSDFYPVINIYEQNSNLDANPRWLIYGVDENYFEENNIDIIEGTIFDKDKKEIIANKKMKILENGVAREIQIGDIVSLPIGYRTNDRFKIAPIVEYYEEYEVVGLYKPRNPRIDKYEEDYLLNERYYVSQKECIDLYENFISLYRENNLKTLYSDKYYVPNFHFSGVSLKFENEEEMNKAYKLIESDFISFNNKLKDIKPDADTYSLTTTDEYINNIMYPFKSLNDNFTLIEIVMIIASIIIVVLIVSLNIKNRMKEFGIKRVLGMHNFQVALAYIVENIIICLLASFLSILIYKLFIASFLNNVVSDNLNVLSELVRIAGDDKIISINFNSHFINPNVSAYLPLVLFSLLIVAILSLILYLLFTHKNLRETLV